jgi:SAM-dependent methyltransferase
MSADRDKLDHDKIYTRSEYRKVIAWPERIEREAPFLEHVLGEASPRRLLDVGCGTGEHSRHFAERGFTTVGIDISENMIEDAVGLAGPTEAGGSARYELREAAAAADLPEAPFGGAICLGNTLAFLESEEELARFLGGIAAALAPGAPFLVQLLNYERIEMKGIRHLPLNFRSLPEEEGDGEIVFLRILDPRGDGTIDFFPVSMTIRPDHEPPVEIRSARQAKHIAWKRATLEKAFASAGFDRIRMLGGMSEMPFEPLDSPDLVLIARRGLAAEGLAETAPGDRTER